MGADFTDSREGRDRFFDETEGAGLDAGKKALREHDSKIFGGNTPDESNFPDALKLLDEVKLT